MNLKNLISANDFCVHHNIEISIISSLHDNGMIRITTIENRSFIHKKQLPELEKFIRFYADLGINLEGIEAINQLLTRMNKMQNEINALKNRLCIYESVSW